MRNKKAKFLRKAARATATAGVVSLEFKQIGTKDVPVFKAAYPAGSYRRVYKDLKKTFKSLPKTLRRIKLSMMDGTTIYG